MWKRWLVRIRPLKLNSFSTDEKLETFTNQTFFVVSTFTIAQTQKQRLLILADMGNESDEVQQMVHMIM